MKLPAWHSSGNRDQAWKNSMSGLGRKLMASMGWKEGESLGAKDGENGLVKCLQPDVGYEKSTKGIGADKSIHSSSWWDDAFKSGASNLKKGKKKKKKEKKEKKESKKKEKKGKSKSKSSKASVGTSVVAEVSVPFGFSGFREGKMARIRRQEEEEAALLARAKGKEGKAATAGKVRGREEGSEDKAERKAKKKAKKVKKIEIELKDSEVRKIEVKEIAVNWWGRALFTRSSYLLGDQELKTKGTKDSAFTERDQEELYRHAHTIGTKDRQGLGLSKELKTSEFTGKKIKF